MSLILDKMNISNRVLVVSVYVFTYVYLRLCMYYSEWSVASIDSRLAVSMSKNVAKTVVFFCAKSEQMVRRVRCFIS